MNIKCMIIYPFFLGLALLNGCGLTPAYKTHPPQYIPDVISNVNHEELANVYGHIYSRPSLFSLLDMDEITHIDDTKLVINDGGYYAGAEINVYIQPGIHNFKYIDGYPGKKRVRIIRRGSPGYAQSLSNPEYKMKDVRKTRPANRDFTLEPGKRYTWQELMENIYQN